MDNHNPIEELKALEQQVERVQDLTTLQQISRRVDELALQHTNNFSVQILIGDLQQHLLKTSSALRERRLDALPPAAGPPATGNNILSTAIMPPLRNILETGGKAQPATLQPTAPPALPPLSSPIRSKSTKTLWLAGGAGAVIAIASLALGNTLLRRLNKPANVTSTDVFVQISSVPSGASIHIKSASREDTKCITACQLSLPSGDYEVTATLDGYQPASSRLTVLLGRGSELNLKLEAEPQTLRVVADFLVGKVQVDDGESADLEKGRFEENVAPGLHSVKITSPGAEATFRVEFVEAKLPLITGIVDTRNVLAILVSSFNTEGRLITNSGPWKVAWNGQAENDVGPAGATLKIFRPGEAELELTQGSQRRSLKETFTTAPTVTVFLKTGLNRGTLPPPRQVESGSSPISPGPREESTTAIEQPATSTPQRPPITPTPAPVPSRTTSVAPRSAPRSLGMEGFENGSAWKEDDGVFRHRGEALLGYKAPADGVFIFDVHLLRGGNLFSRGRARWVLNYQDAKNYSLFEVDETNLTAKDVVNGKSTDHAKVRHLLDGKRKAWTIRADVSPERIIHSIQRNNQWITLHTWAQAGRDFSKGKFGFLVRGNDEIGVSNFTFTPR